MYTIYDTDGNLLKEDPDFEKGYTSVEKQTVHHPAGTYNDTKFIMDDNGPKEVIITKKYDAYDTEELHIVYHLNGGNN